MIRPTALIAFVMLCMGSVNASDDGQLLERLNPDICVDEPAHALDYSAYHVKLQNNHVDLNGDDWSILSEKFAAAARGDSAFRVVYLGDSHVQADFGGDVLRKRLAAESRYMGRGIIVPLKLAGTNQPVDYSMSMTSPYIASTLMRKPWSTEMTFTGVALQPMTDVFDLKVHLPSPACHLRLFTRGGLFSAGELSCDDGVMPFDSHVDADGLLNICSEKPVSDFVLTLHGDGQAVLGGIEAMSDSVGTVLHSIGNNGATYSAYSLVDRFGSEFSALHPDLVIIALGTNEAFGRTSVADLTVSIENLIGSIRRYSPHAKILLVGPAECYRKTYTRRKGRRRVRSQVVNTKVATLARAIRLYAEANNIPYYNHYAVAGRAASLKNAHLLGKDGVHYTREGYKLWGNLLADALLERLKQ